MWWDVDLWRICVVNYPLRVKTSDYDENYFLSPSEDISIKNRILKKWICFFFIILTNQQFHILRIKSEWKKKKMSLKYTHDK